MHPNSHHDTSDDTSSTSQSIKTTDKGQSAAYHLVNNKNINNNKKPKLRPQLSETKMQQLEALEFPWEVQSWQWNGRYQQLVAFQQRHGHVRVPANCAEYPGLGIWVRNQ